MTRANHRRRKQAQQALLFIETSSSKTIKNRQTNWKRQQVTISATTTTITTIKNTKTTLTHRSSRHRLI